MTKISSDSLFHFTPRLEYLVNILKIGFSPRYCFDETNLPLAFPMICFCDILLSNTLEHIKMYGNYGLGMNKSWILKNKLNPVNYTSEDSHYHKSYQEVIDSAIEVVKNKDKDEPQSDSLILTTSLIEIVRYSKSIEGNFIRGTRIVTKKFYDEREWRYVPPFKENSSIQPFLSKAEYEKSKTAED